MRERGQPLFTPRDPAFAERVRDSFLRQPVMELIGANMTRIDPGEIVIELPFRADLAQQHGYFHAGIVATAADSAGGYAAYSLMPAGSSVLTVEYKIHLLSPADGERLVASGHVVKSGRTLTVCEFDAAVLKNGSWTTCAWGTQTVICLEGRSDRPSAE
jgi:uncharacterized protein (TIGR00369 family)